MAELHCCCVVIGCSSEVKWKYCLDKEAGDRGMSEEKERFDVDWIWLDR